MSGGWGEFARASAGVQDAMGGRAMEMPLMGLGLVALRRTSCEPGGSPNAETPTLNWISYQPHNNIHENFEVKTARNWV
ncbi:MAG: hypothetical protein LBU32_25945 [Clostridiales bacterium]|nr:hypothetical protein [Clostridiales bacterium]